MTRRRPRSIRDRPSPRIPELDVAVGEHDDRLTGLVHEAMMAAAEEHEIPDLRLTAARPVLDVMCVEEAAVVAPREAATSVSCLERPPDRRRNRAGLSSHRQRLAVLFDQLHDGGVTRKPACRLVG